MPDLDTYSYNVDDYGTLSIYDANGAILCEISDCSGLSNKEIVALIVEVISER